jgi:hypothetical protein
MTDLYDENDYEDDCDELTDRKPKFSLSFDKPSTAERIIRVTQ